MNRFLTCACLLLAIGSGLHLYQVKHQAQMLEREIGRTVQAAAAAHERIRMLRAEWALLNEPERLQDLSGRHLAALRPLAPTQFVPLAELGAHLAPPGMPLGPDDAGGERVAQTAPVGLPVEAPGDEDADMDMEAGRNAPASSAPAARPKLAQAPLRLPSQISPQASSVRRERPAARPTVVATAPVPHREPARQAVHAPAPGLLAAAHAPVAIAPPRPVAARVVTAMLAPAERLSPAIRVAGAYVRAQPVPLAAPGPGFGSALGMAHAILPPPVPVAAYR